MGSVRPTLNMVVRLHCLAVALLLIQIEIPALISMPTQIRVYSKITPHLEKGSDREGNVMRDSVGSFLSPPSFSLTETDREYYNIVRTENGISQFFKEIHQKQINMMTFILRNL